LQRGCALSGRGEQRPETAQRFGCPAALGALSGTRAQASRAAVSLWASISHVPRLYSTSPRPGQRCDSRDSRALALFNCRFLKLVLCLKQLAAEPPCFVGLDREPCPRDKPQRNHRDQQATPHRLLEEPGETKSPGGVVCSAGALFRLTAKSGETMAGSVSFGRNDLAVGFRAEGHPGPRGDRVLDEPHASVREQDVDAARVVALGVGEERVVRVQGAGG
jgi:hypothetical protein